jgi:hypothetical protein
MERVFFFEQTRDKNRNKKLETLLNPNNNFKNINTVEIVNLTPHEIPQKIKEFLHFGRNIPTLLTVMFPIIV